jgi:hypothetical protein
MKPEMTPVFGFFLKKWLCFGHEMPSWEVASFPEKG